MKQYTHQTYLKASIDHVAKFHHDPQAIKFLTPPPVFVQIHRAEPLAENSKAEFTFWLGPIPVRWKALHTRVDLMHGFTDTQVVGPFQFWAHRHAFTELGAHSTLVIDEIQAEYGTNLWSGLISRIMWLNLPILFGYRGWVMKRLLEKHSSENGYQGE